MASKKKNIVDQLRRAMRESGETEYAIAKASVVSQSVVNRFVSGERGISLETAAKLCEYLEIELVRRR
jgi:transcriptional regulator with XRE-family HTH domain